MAAEHGGKLNKFAQQYHSDPKDWLDLSTGVSPFVYPVDKLPLAVWNRLPEVDDGLERVAKEYYRAQQLPVCVAGTQAAIMVLPKLVTLKLGRCGRVTLPRVGYKEHQYAWAEMVSGAQNWQLDFYDDFPSPEQIDNSDVVVVINPNNPSGRFYQATELMAASEKMTQKGGFLIVDEAFADCTPEISLLNHRSTQQDEGLIVLRSVGKFFGLAGARVGFVFAQSSVAILLEELLGPWTVSGPARWVVKQALSDTAWQQCARQNILSASGDLKRLLDQYFVEDKAGTDLFTTVYLPDACQCHHWLCQNKVLTRLCDERNALRFGLPADAEQLEKLESALIELAQKRNA